MPVAVERANPTQQRLATGARMALIGIGVNALLAVIKISAGVLGHSYALIADGLESSLDIVSSMVIWGGLVFAARPADATHPYGHGKAEPLAAVAVSLLVIAAAFGLAVESVREILTPHHPPAPFTLMVLVGVVAVKEFLFRRVLHAAENIGSSAVKTDAWHHRADAITSAAAFVGISIALIGGPGYEPADDWAALLACGLIAYNGWRLLVPALNETLDVAPPPAIEAEVRRLAAQVPGVLGLEKCRVRKMGLDLYVDIHVLVDGDISVREGHRIAHEVKDAVRTGNPAVADLLVHIEPAHGAPSPTAEP